MLRACTDGYAPRPRLASPGFAAANKLPGSHKHDTIQASQIRQMIRFISPVLEAGFLAPPPILSKRHWTLAPHSTHHPAQEACTEPGLTSQGPPGCERVRDDRPAGPAHGGTHREARYGAVE